MAHHAILVLCIAFYKCLQASMGWVSCLYRCFSTSAFPESVPGAEGVLVVFLRFFLDYPPQKCFAINDIFIHHDWQLVKTLSVGSFVTCLLPALLPGV